MNHLNLFSFKKDDLVKINLTAFDENNNEIDSLKQNNYLFTITDQKDETEIIPFLLINKPLKENIELEYQFSKDVLIEELKGKKIKFVISLLDYKTAEFIQLSAELKKAKNDIAIKDLNFQNKTKELQHVEEQLKLALNDVKKAKEAQVVERLTLPKEELDNIKKYSLQKFVEDFTNPYGTLKMAINAGENSSSQEVKNYLMGFKMVLGMLENSLNNHGITEFQPSLNTEFDPETSKIIEQVVNDDLKPNTILKVNQNGFKLYDRVIKPALVVASKYSDEKAKTKENKKNKKMKTKQ
ncbi:nucleotide exchange factor GrpE [Mycoplasmopsis columbina]|uniref:Protein GrpE n=1 Tax=Mycoplasmopsis columbina SF7 TaxID=1037410 RepID=F9UKD5_9BACT|nr:nucleotide exchange factor GrpE [Mycoplasmopsis columbina]EGV00140.1 hypothetical protein MCSF7_01731 [Mycoplasmopsis columbina SF7]VEU77036.1 heat shock protein [Mycoplasmopsis columbina]